MEINNQFQTNAAAASLNNEAPVKKKTQQIKPGGDDNQKRSNPTIAVKDRKESSSANPADNGNVEANKSKSKHKATDPVIKMELVKDSSQTKLVINGEKKSETGKSSKAELEKFMQRNPTDWSSSDGKKVGKLKSQPYNH